MPREPAARVGGATVYSDAAALLAARDIEGVYPATPPAKMAKGSSKGFAIAVCRESGGNAAPNADSS